MAELGEKIYPTTDRNCPKCGTKMEQHGWCSTDPASATDWVKCPRCGYSRRENGREIVIKKGKFGGIDYGRYERTD